MPSPRPSAPRWSVLLALTDTASAADAEQRGDRARAWRRGAGPAPAPVRSRSRPGCRGAKPRAPTSRATSSTKTRLVDAVPARVAAREVAPMSPAPERPEERVAHRVQHAVPVRVALEPARRVRSRRRRAAGGGPPPAGGRRSPVPTASLTLLHGPASTPSAHARSSGVVILRLRGGARHRAHRPAQPLDRHRLVGERDPVARGRLARLAEQREAEALRRLRRRRARRGRGSRRPRRRAPA